MAKLRFRKYVWQLALAIIPVLLAITLTVLFLQDSRGVQHLEYLETVQHRLIELPDLLSDKLQITYGGSPVVNLSSVKYRIINRTGKNYEDVGLYFEFIPVIGEHPEFPLIGNKVPQLLSKSITGPENYPNMGFEEIDSPDPNTVGWVIKAFNSSSDPYNQFEVTFVFAEPNPPFTDISILKGGVDLKPWVTPQKSLWSMIRLLQYVLVIALFLLVVPGLVKGVLMIAKAPSTQPQEENQKQIKRHTKGREEN